MMQVPLYHLFFWFSIVYLKVTIEQFHVTSFTVHIRFMAAMLVYYNVQYSMGEKHFHCRYGATQVAIWPSLA